MFYDGENQKILLACAFFHYILKPIGILSKILQEEGLCIVKAIEAFLRTKKNLEDLKTKNISNRPTIKNVLG